MIGYVCPKGHKGVTEASINAQLSVLIWYCGECKGYYETKIGETDEKGKRKGSSQD